MSCSLTFLSGSCAGQALELDQTEFWIGRDPRCEIPLGAEMDLLVSGRHLRIYLVGDEYHLESYGSNGTFLNGEQVHHAALKQGDIVELGKGEKGVSFRFEYSRKQELSRQRPAGNTVERKPNVVEKPAVNAQPSSHKLFAAMPLGEGRREMRLTRLDTHKTYQVNREVVRLGRDPAADIPFDLQTDLLVSHNHAKILWLNQSAILIDTESTNGTFINGKRISRRELQEGDTIELGGAQGPKLQVSFEVASAPMSGQHLRSTMMVDGEMLAAAINAEEAVVIGRFPLGETLTIGRSSQCDITLDSMFVSTHHATVTRHAHGALLVDHQSANGTFFDGERVSRVTLDSDATFVIGPFTLRFEGATIAVLDTRKRVSIDAFGLSCGDAKRRYLDNVSLKIAPGEFICVLGPSGSGKSTLVKCLCGSVRAHQGTVLLNQIHFYRHYPALRHHVGYVPQDDIIHAQLTVGSTLHHAAKLRLPSWVSDEKRTERVNDVLSMLELYDHRHKVVASLSGGQRKRVSIAVELLTEPAILFLDEPTSGLDPHLEEKLMLLLRELTLRGTTVVAVTHTLDNVHLADKLTFLVDGKLVFFGEPQEAKAFFEVEQFPDIYKRFEEQKDNARSLSDAFGASPYFQRHIKSRLTPLSTIDDAVEAPAQRRTERGGALRQFKILSQRYVELITRDTRNTILLFAQAPLIATFICLAMKSDQPRRGPTSTMLLALSLSALWFGCSNAARELTKEIAVYRRERMVNLGVLPYVASKFFVLQFLAALQVGMMLAIVSFFRSGYSLVESPLECTRWGIEACRVLIIDGLPGSFPQHFLNLYLTALNGIGLGLLISSVASNSDKAMALIPVVLIPQVLFSGAFGLPGPDDVTKRSINYVMALNWSLDQGKRIAMCSRHDEKPPDNPGSGCVRCLHAYDPFKAERLDVPVQMEDRLCEALIPVVSHLAATPETIEVVEDGLYTPPSRWKSGSARDTTKAFISMFVQGGYALLLFVLVCAFVRRRDRILK